jgi:hypothetical protein
MEFLREYALLVAVATPVLVIVGFQAVLFVTGERGTLLLPSLAPFESIDIEAAQPDATVADAQPPRTVCVESAHDDRLDRLAA